MIKTNEEIRKALEKDKLIAYYIQDCKYPKSTITAIMDFIRLVRLQDKLDIDKYYNDKKYE